MVKRISAFLLLRRRFFFVTMMCGVGIAPAFALQQKVDYTISINFDPASRIISGVEQIHYMNFSPDKIGELFAHLYWNAFQPGSQMQAHWRETGDYSGAEQIASLTPSQQGRVQIDSVRVNGAPLPWTIAGTIMHVKLAHPIEEGTTAEITIAFTTHIPDLIRRSGYMNGDSVEFSMAQWYPKICAYDERGWHTDQYLGREFYGEFGRFNVNIIAPYDYCIAASGYNINAFNSGCGYTVRQDSIILFPAARDSSRKDLNFKMIDTAKTRRWQFEADNVHDFAWAADREFVHQIVVAKFKTIHLFYKRRDLAKWSTVGKETAKAIAYLGERYGEYGYDQFSVVQAGDGGMEYPQIIFLRGTPSSNTLVHETAHQWFYGMLGSNESAEAWLDEGFTTFVTDRAMHDLYGEVPVKRSWLGSILLPNNDPRATAFRVYQRQALSGREEPVLQHSDAFAENAGYREVYYKTEAILTMLEYTVGDSTFARIMRAYTSKFRFKHPTSEDFIRTCTEVSGMDLKWFFDEWLHTTKKCDYAICGVTSKPSDSGFTTTLELHRNGKIIMPVDVDLKYSDGSHQLVTVPCSWYAKNDGGNIVLPQWGAPMRSYQTSFSTPHEVASAEIDPSYRLQDLNRLNNSTGFFPPMRFGLYTQFESDAPSDAYTISLAPRIWYSALQGTKLGLSFNGGYSFDRYLFDGGFYFNTLHQTADWWLHYKRELMPDAFAYLNANQAYGIRSALVRVERLFKSLSVSQNEQLFSLEYNYSDLPADIYPFYTFLWSRGELNSAKAAYRFTHHSASTLIVDLSFESSLTKQTGFTKADFTADWKFPLWVLRGNVRVAVATAGGAVPLQKQLYLSAASPEEQFSNTLYRGIAMVNQSLDTSAHLLLAGGGGMIGYEDRYAELSGSSIATINAECALPLLRGDHAVSVAAFGGWGYLSDQTLSLNAQLGAPYFDAGVSLKYLFNGGDASLLQSLLMTHAPLSVEIAVPFFVSRPATGEQEIAKRFRVGISAGL